MDEVRHIVIVGAGFSGAMTARRVLDRARAPVRITLVDGSGRFGPGVAYSTDDPAHLLNVAAGRMGGLSEAEDDFLKWLRERDPSVDTGAFVPRLDYGRYIAHRLAQAERGSAYARLDRLADVAVSMEPARERWVVRFACAPLLADRVVLAIGHAPPADPPVDDRSFYSSSAYIRSPWSPEANRIKADDPVVVIGTGLTMVDVLESLRARGHRARVVAISRRGLAPQRHRSPSRPPKSLLAWPELALWDGRAASLLRMVRGKINAARAEGTDWREVINSLRPVTQAVWGRMPTEQRRKFMSRIRPYWDVHRHRAADQVGASIDRLVASGALEIVCGKLEAAAATGGGATVTIALRGGGVRTVDAAWVVNCTGPQTDLAQVDNPLIVHLLAKGVIVRDPLGLGLETAEDGAVLDREGRASATVFTLGPTMRPRLWETIAVPELRHQAAALGDRLLQ